MTKERFEELITNGTPAEIREAVDGLVTEQNGFYRDEKITEAFALNDDIDQLVGRYTHLVRKACFDELLKEEHPLYAACLKLTFPTIRVRQSKDKDTGIISREMVEVDKDIDLFALARQSKDGIGSDRNWIHMLQQLNYRLACSVGQAIGDPKWEPKNLKNVSDSFVMSDIARQYSFGKNPCSNTQLLKTLTTIVQAMIGEEYKPTSHDVNDLKAVYAQRGKRRKEVRLPNHKTFCLMMADICENCITHTGYTANSKCVKEKK